MSIRRAIQAIMIGAISYVLALIYVPRCGVEVYAQNATPLSIGLAAVITFCAYRFQ